MPASIAAIKGSVAMCCSVSGADVFECGLEFGKGTLDGEGDRRLHFLRDLSSQLVRFSGVQQTRRDQDTAKTRHGVAAQGRLVLLALAEHRDRLVLRIVQ